MNGKYIRKRKMKKIRQKERQSNEKLSWNNEKWTNEICVQASVYVAVPTWEWSNLRTCVLKHIRAFEVGESFTCKYQWIATFPERIQSWERVEAHFRDDRRWPPMPTSTTWTKHDRNGNRENQQKNRHDWGSIAGKGKSDADDSKAGW